MNDIPMKKMEICRYLESRFGKGSPVSSLLTGFGVKALPEKGYTVCGLLADDPTLASVRKARHCLAFLYGVGADAMEAATWYDSLMAAKRPKIDASGSNLDQNLDRAIVRQGPDHGGIWRISRRVAQNGVLNPGTSEVAEKPNKVAEKVTEKSGEVTEKVTEKSGEVTEKSGEVTEKVTEKLSETDERIIALIQSNPHITQKMLSEAIGLTRPYIGRKLLELQVRNIIRRICPDKGGYWEVSGMANRILENGEES